MALATQKFISDIAQDAYEYSRIRSASAVYNSSNPQVRAKLLLQGQQYANQQTLTGNANNNGEGDQQQSLQSHSNAGNQQGKIVLTMEDLSNALSEYGMNTSRPDFTGNALSLLLQVCILYVYLLMSCKEIKMK